MQSLTITKKEEGQRLDKFLKKYLPEAPAGFIYKMMRKKNITLNKKKTAGTEILAEGDTVALFLSEETIGKFHGRIPSGETKAGEKLDVVYGDGDVLFVNKPAGLLTQPAKKGDPSLVDMLVPFLLEEGRITQEDLRAFRPAPVNRLDRNTSGLVLCGTSLAGSRFLSEEIRSREVKKTYLALVRGKQVPEGEMVTFYKKNAADNTVRLSGREKEGSGVMKTHFHVLVENGPVALVSCRLITGKTHQIRAQLAFAGAPILGDPKYGDREANEAFAHLTGVRRQMLHASCVGFPDQLDRFERLAGREFTAPLPADFQKACRSYGIAIE